MTTPTTERSGVVWSREVQYRGESSRFVPSTRRWPRASEVLQLRLGHYQPQHQRDQYGGHDHQRQVKQRMPHARRVGVAQLGQYTAAVQMEEHHQRDHHQLHGQPVALQAAQVHQNGAADDRNHGSGRDHHDEAVARHDAQPVVIGVIFGFRVQHEKSGQVEQTRAPDGQCRDMQRFQPDHEGRPKSATTLDQPPPRKKDIKISCRHAANPVPDTN